MMNDESEPKRLSFIPHSSFIIHHSVACSDKYRKNIGTLEGLFKGFRFMLLLPQIVNQFHARKQMKNETTTRTIEFTIEKSETFTIRRIRKIAAVWCSHCGCEVRMSSPEDAAHITGVSTRRIYSRIEAGSAHFAESAAGVLMVCHRSLSETEPGRERE